VGTAIGHYTVDGKLAADNATTAALESMPTRLASVEPDLQGWLINWGYALADAALRAPSRANLSIATASTLPRPAAPLN
jgi:NTE family protein